MRIDDLAREAGTTVRNVRAHAARGLLPPPAMEGRTGWYDDVHLHRLQLIGELQERGFSLAAVEQTLRALEQGDQLGNLLGIEHVLTATFAEDTSVHLSLAEMVDRFPESLTDEELVPLAARIGLLAPDGEDGFRVISPVVLEAGEALGDAGVPLRLLLEVLERVNGHLEAVARDYVDLVADHVVEPALEGSPEAVRTAVQTVERLLPLAIEVTRPFLARELRAAVDAAAARLLADGA